MKILILTHPLRFNYGGILQNYALQRVLLSLGHDVYTIDWNDDKSFIYMLLSFIKRLFLHYFLQKKHIPTNFYINLTRKQFLEINENNQKFIEKNIKRTDYISSIRKLSKVNKMKFDAIVVGSDQVWLEQFVPMMYLNFLKLDVKRISYAASFGKSEWTYSKKNTEIARILINKFHAVSVREESAVSLCREYLKCSASWVLDPTMLLTSEQYNQIISDSDDSLPRNPYLMAYILDDSPLKTKISDILKIKLGLDKYEIYARSNSDNMKKVPSVLNWLLAIKNAEFVVTDSFHGMVFSIIYNKPFVVIENEERGMARFVSLLNILGLEDRLFNSNNDINLFIDNLNEINYNSVNEILKYKRNQSFEFLLSSLLDNIKDKDY